MAEARAGRRQSPQAQLDMSAFEKAVAADQKATKVEAELAAHERICSERYKLLDANVADVKSDIRMLNDDAKHAIDEVRKQQEEHHKSNKTDLQTLTTGLSELNVKIGSAQGRFNGASGIVDLLIKLIPLVLSGLTLYAVWGHK